MCQVKHLFDPAGMLNPGVLINDDADVHLRDIKSTPAVAEEVDRCVSCGYCEPVCPSREITLTPRQRIVTLRAIEQARIDGDTALAAELTKDYDYNAVQTCAVDGMCQTACPVNIDTGLLVKSLRTQEKKPVANAVWNVAAQNWGGVTRAAGLALTVVNKVPAPLVLAPNAIARAVLGSDTVPLYSDELPAGGVSRRRPAPGHEASVVYFPACVNTMFGAADGASDALQVSFEELCERAGITLLVPPAIDSLCCGTPWASKGMSAGAATMRERTLAALHTATNDGALTIICDASSCTEGLRQTIDSDTSPNRLTVMDAVEFAAARILPFLPEYAKLESLALHPTCSSTRLGINDALSNVADAVADRVDVPENWGCCGFAGDRGMLHPELTESATRVQAAEVVALDATAHASCNRTCELGMTRATQEPYRHVLEILNDLSRPS
jgi:D-lactate dehydrogenase